MNDIGSKGIQTLINEFWTNEQNELKQKTCLKIIIESECNIFESSNFEDGKFIITQDFADEILSEYENLEDLQNDLFFMVIMF